VIFLYIYATFFHQILQLRRHIEEVSSKEPYMGEQMPIKWLQFEQMTAELVAGGTYFSSKDQVIT
jgi:hypothetical protein